MGSEIITCELNSPVRNRTGTVPEPCLVRSKTLTAPQPTSTTVSVQRGQPVEKVFSMSQGDGDESYSKNSQYQAILNKLSQPVLTEALERMTLSLSERGSPGQGAVVVVDLGCSSGPNSILNIRLILDKLKLRLTQDAHFQVFFNDLPSNDFNNLFRLLANDSCAGQLFTAGVPGSFFGRLFPSSSVHVFHSSWCLHWMSKIPDAVLCKDSPTYNKGRLWITHANPAVSAEYRQQASRDLTNFLLARAAELVPGGVLFFSVVGRSPVDPTEPTTDLIIEFMTDLSVIWTDLVAEGILTEQQLDTFNFPFYPRSIEEIRQELESCGSLFDVLTVEMEKIELTAGEVFGITDYTPASVLASKLKNMLSSISNNLVAAHVGQTVSEFIWTRYENLLQEKIRLNPQNSLIEHSVCLISLIRK